MQILSPIPECTIVISTKEDHSMDTLLDVDRVIGGLSNLSKLPVILPSHEHATGFREITRENSVEVEFPADILLTKERHVALAHQFADCVPLLFVDRKHKAIGFAHLGWKGLTMGGVQVSIVAMEAKFGSKPADLWVWIGPCIQKDSYSFEDKPTQLSLPVWEESIVKRAEKYHIDMPHFIAKECAKYGIDPTQIINDGRDTYRERETFFSHQIYLQKRNPKDKGVFAVVCWIH